MAEVTQQAQQETSTQPETKREASEPKREGGQSTRESSPPAREGPPARENREGNRGPREGNREGRGQAGGGREGRGGGHGDRREGGRPDRGGDRGDRGRFEGPPEIDIEKLISDPLYLDNQAHGVVSRMRDMDSGTRSQLRRLYNAVRRAVRAPENERQQQFVMLRARLAYTIARHSLRSLDSLEKLLLQVTRKNDARGYERFRDLFEAIIAYNE
jgi:CRISPR type III-A-associated protein Csm2